MAHDAPLMRALGLAHHWQRLLDEGRFGSITEIATAEVIDVTQVRRLTRLRLLAPHTIERLVGSPDIMLSQLMRCPWPDIWCAQMRVLAR